MSASLNVQDTLIESVCKVTTESQLKSALKGNQFEPTITTRYCSCNKRIGGISQFMGNGEFTLGKYCTLYNTRTDVWTGSATVSESYTGISSVGANNKPSVSGYPASVSYDFGTDEWSKTGTGVEFFQGGLSYSLTLPPGMFYTYTDPVSSPTALSESGGFGDSWSSTLSGLIDTQTLYETARDTFLAESFTWAGNQWLMTFDEYIGNMSGDVSGVGSFTGAASVASSGADPAGIPSGVHLKIGWNVQTSADGQILIKIFRGMVRTTSTDYYWIGRWKRNATFDQITFYSEGVIGPGETIGYDGDLTSPDVEIPFPTGSALPIQTISGNEISSDFYFVAIGMSARDWATTYSRTVIGAP